MATKRRMRTQNQKPFWDFYGFCGYVPVGVSDFDKAAHTETFRCERPTPALRATPPLQGGVDLTAFLAVIGGGCRGHRRRGNRRNGQAHDFAHREFDAAAIVCVVL